MEMGVPHPRRCRALSARRISQSPDDRNTLQRLFRPGLPRAHRSLSRNRRHYGGVHQPVADARDARARCGQRRRCPSPSSHHDDHAGRDTWPAPGRDVARYRLRLPAPIRHRHRGRIDCRTSRQRDPLADLVRLLGPPRRPPASIRAEFHGRRRARRLVSVLSASSAEFLCVLSG